MFTGFEKYIDAEYDGVVIKLPAAFIDINRLEPMLENFLDQLNKVPALSLMMPDYNKSMYELANYKEKKEHLKKLADEQKERECTRRLWTERRLNREILDVIWVENKEVIDHESIECGPDVYKFRDLMNKRGYAFKSKQLAKILEFIHGLKTDDDAYKFMYSNGLGGQIGRVKRMKFNEHWRFAKNALYIDNYGNPTIRIEILGIKYFVIDGAYYKVQLRRDIVDKQENGILIFSPPKRDLEKVYLINYDIGFHLLTIKEHLKTK